MWDVLKYSLPVTRICQPLALAASHTHVSADSQGTSLTLSGSSSTDATNLQQILLFKDILKKKKKEKPLKTTKKGKKTPKPPPPQKK